MGSALGAMGWASGGVSGMRAVGIAQTAYEGVNGTLDFATDFIPGGKIYKNISGLANYATKGKYGTSLVKGARAKNGGVNGSGANGIGEGEGGGIN